MPLDTVSYCDSCNLHFAPARTDGRCPNCGRRAGQFKGRAADVSTATSGRSAETSTTVATAAADSGVSPVSGAAIESTLDDLADSQATRTSLKLLGRTPRAASARHDRTASDPNVAAHEWPPGRVIAGKYEVVCKLGDGGFGSVHKVRHLQRKKLYALKTPHPEFLRDETFRRRFEREIQALERFVHPEMVTIRDSGVTEDGVPYYTMDFVEGESLRAVLRREERLSPCRAVRVAAHVLLVLEAAHENQIIHRDIKPDNVLLTREGDEDVVKVLDFGVAKLLDAVHSTLSLTDGMRVGTPKYMSPEQVMGEPVDGRSDLFAVGMLLYEMLTGTHPFAVSGDPVRTTAAILRKEVANPSSLREDIPADLSAAILRMLEKKPSARPQTAREALELLPRPSEIGLSSRSTIASTPHRVHSGAPRQSVRALVLERSTPLGEERNFLFFSNSLRLGRGDVSADGIANDLVLRRLPCRSRRQDASNWEANLTISQHAATLQLDGPQVLIEPGSRASYGIVVGGLRTRETVRVQSDRFQISLGDRALDIDGLRSLRSTQRQAHDLSFVQPIDPAWASDKRRAGIGYSDPDCAIDYVRLTRGQNHPLHRYFLVARRLTIGSGATAGLTLPDTASTCGQHACLIYDRGELFLARTGGDVRVEPSGGVSRAGSPESSRAAVRPGDETLYPITPGLYIRLGDVTFHVRDVTPDLFKTT